MARSDLVKLAERELKPYGIGRRDISTISIGMEAYELIWTHNGQSHRIHLPRDADNPREKAIFRSNLEKQLREFGVKLLDPSSGRVDIEEQLEGIRGELSANRERCGSIEEMFLEWASEQEKKLEARLANQDNLIAATLQKKPAEVTPAQQISQAVTLQPTIKTPQRVVAEEEPKKGLDALSEVKKQQWAKIIEQMNADFDLDELDLRILFFLHETGRPQSAHTLREAGVWKAVSSATKHLENMEAAGWVVPVAREWGITRRGISKLQEAYNEAEPEEAPADPSAFEEIEAARGEPNHAKMVKVYTPPTQPGMPPVPTSVEAAKPPALTVVPITEQKPKARILTPVPTSTYTFGARSVKDDMLVYLYMREQAWSKSHTEPFPGRTSAEMKADSVRGYGLGEKDVGIAASMAKQTGHLTQVHKGAPYSLTSIGRTQAKRALSESANGSDLNRRFV